MNKVFLTGRLARDPELRYTSNNTPVATFTIAVDRGFGGNRENQNPDQPTADFISVVVWNKQGENVKNYLHQGSKVAVDGRLQVRNYDAQDGSKRYVTEVVASSVEFLDSKNSSNNTQSNESKNETKTPYDFSEETPEATDVSGDPYADFASNIEISEDELPF